MSIRTELQPRKPTLRFLKRCYRFVSREWQHALRESLPDQGFELRFRESCVKSLDGWSISESCEMRLGAGLETASGCLHEIDLTVRGPGVTGIVEMKNRSATPPDKNDVIVFFAKVLDYLTANPDLASSDVCLVFISSNSFEPRGLAACLGLGIHPVAPDIRPLPILVNNARIWSSRLHDGHVVSVDVRERFDDLCSQLNNLSSTLNETWLDSRCGQVSDDRIVIRALAPLPADYLAEQFRQANSDCTDIFPAFESALES